MPPQTASQNYNTPPRYARIRAHLLFYSDFALQMTAGPERLWRTLFSFTEVRCSLFYCGSSHPLARTQNTTQGALLILKRGSRTPIPLSNYRTDRSIGLCTPVDLQAL